MKVVELNKHSLEVKTIIFGPNHQDRKKEG